MIWASKGRGLIMEFNEKLQKLRTSQNLTQEELAEKLYVSRAAISKWESGRGYPSIDSLKMISKYFHVTIDELICGEEMVTLAEQDIKESNQKYSLVICGILDCLMILLFFIPVFGNHSVSAVTAVSLLNLTDISMWLKTAFIVIVGLTVVNGFCSVVISGFDKSLCNKHRFITGIVLSTISTALFVLARQPYAGVFFLSMLVIKGFLVWKAK